MTEVPRRHPSEVGQNLVVGPRDEYHKPYPPLAREANVDPVVVFLEIETIRDGEVEVETIDSGDPYHAYIRREESFNHPCG